MIALIPTPRWLPATIGVLAGLLAMKSVTLVRAVTSPGQPVDLSFLSSNARAADKPAEQKPAAAASANTPPAEPAPAEPPMTQAERTILLELRQRRQELDSRTAALAERESVMTAAQEKLAARVEELRGLQQNLESMTADRRKQDDTSWQGLVKLYETMKPREAATIFNDLAMPVLVPVMDRMKDAKAAAVLAAMDPDKARQVTQALAKLRSHADVEPKSSAASRQTPAASAPAGQSTTPPPTPARARQPNS